LRIDGSQNCAIVGLFMDNITLGLGFILEGAAVMWIGGALSSVGEVFLRFREALLSRESDSEELWEDSESEASPD
jgi:hypothetical protein